MIENGLVNTSASFLSMLGWIPSGTIDLCVSKWLKILSSHEWVTLGIALFTTQSWAITSVSGKA